jgi:hypothetical protein
VLESERERERESEKERERERKVEEWHVPLLRGSIP